MLIGDRDYGSILFGIGGDDHLVGGWSSDVFYGGDGQDTVSYASPSIGIVADLAYTGGNTFYASGDQFFPPKTCLAPRTMTACGATVRAIRCGEKRATTKSMAGLVMIR